MLNYVWRRGRAYLKYEFQLNLIKNIQKKLLTDGEGRARRAPGVRRTARPNMTDQNTKRNLI